MEDHLRLFMLGKTGSGKSSLANTIFGEEVFEIGHTANPETSQCKKETKGVNGTSVSIIDTPGFFDSGISEADLRKEMIKGVIECSPGPHAFLILLKVEKYTDQENEIITKIKKSFSEEAFRYSVLVFTHGDNLPEGMQIEEFYRGNNRLCELLERCGGRCHVFDNKYWNNNPQDEYRNNQLQRENLLNTIKEMVRNNGGGCYTNEMLQEVEGLIQRMKEKISSLFRNMPLEEIIKEAKKRVYNALKMAASITIGMFWGALLGVKIMIEKIVKILKSLEIPISPLMPIVDTPIVIGVGTGLATVDITGAAAIGTVAGGCIGYHEANKADAILVAVQNTVKTINKKGLQLVGTIQTTESEQSTSLIKRD